MIFTADANLVQGQQETLPGKGVRPREAEALRVFSIPDIMVVSVLALLLFGPDQLPKIMRQAGRAMREVQNTSHSFIAEMERAAEVNDHEMPPPMPPSPPAVHPPDDTAAR
jgi:TatA/E family protein of Tat protein translocase